MIKFTICFSNKKTRQQNIFVSYEQKAIDRDCRIYFEIFICSLGLQCSPNYALNKH